jgi:cbb3-type cytochrome oxidase subunit 3
MKKFLLGIFLAGALVFAASSNAQAQTACKKSGGECILPGNSCASGQQEVQISCATGGGKCCKPSATASGNATSSGNQTTSSATAGSSAVSINLSNPLKYDKVEGVLTSVMGGIKGIVVTLALLMIIIGAIMYILSFGNKGNMERAKSIITAALVGLAIVIAAPAFLREIAGLLGWDNAPPIEGGTSLTLTQIAQRILNFLLSIIGTLALIVMIISGIMYLTSGGSETRMKQARGMFTAALIGIVLAMASLILVSAVAGFFA